MYKLLIPLGVIVTLALVLGGSYISAYNTGNRLENGIKASYTDNQNVLSQYSQKIAEAAQIPAMQRDDLKDVVVAALDARYGEEGSKAMFQFIQEQNPTIDSTVYTQIQRMIEAGRNDFRVAQTKLIDQKRVYETNLGSFWGGTWMSIAGYPKINLDDYKIIVNVQTQNTFENGVEDGPIKLR